MNEREVNDLRVLRDTFVQLSKYATVAEGENRAAQRSRASAYSLSAEWLDELAERHGWWNP